MNSQTGTRTDTTDPGADNNNHLPGAPNHALSTKSSSVTSALSITARAEPTPLRPTSPTSKSSKEHVGARCYGEDVILLVDGEIEREHTGHLSGE